MITDVLVSGGGHALENRWPVSAGICVQHAVPHGREEESCERCFVLLALRALRGIPLSGKEKLQKKAGPKWFVCLIYMWRKKLTEAVRASGGAWYEGEEKGLIKCYEDTSPVIIISWRQFRSLSSSLLWYNVWAGKHFVEFPSLWKQTTKSEISRYLTHSFMCCQMIVFK